MAEQHPSILPSIRTLPLPDDAKPLYSRAARLVLERPDDFKPVGTWLDEHYSEGTLRTLCERKYRNDFAYKLSLLRLHGSGNFALSTYKRRLAIQQGPWIKDLKRGQQLDKPHPRTAESVLMKLRRETIEEARLRGYRLNGRQVVCRTYPDQYPDENVITQANVHIVWEDEDERYRRRLNQIKAKRKSSKMSKYDHPEMPGWRLGRAVGEIIEAGYPADTLAEHVEQSRKIVGLAALLVWPEPLPVLGVFGEWGWASQFAGVEESARRWDKMMAIDPKEAKAGPHALLPTIANPRYVGREEVLFERSPGKPRELNRSDLLPFCELLTVAVDELEAEAGAPAVPSAAQDGKGGAAEVVIPVGFMGIDALCQHFRIPDDKREALRKRLERFRRDHAADGDVFTEHDAQARNESRYLYNPAKIKEQLQVFRLKPRPSARPSNVRQKKIPS